MIKKIPFGLLTASALTMLSAFPVLDDNDMDISTGFSSSTSIEEKDGHFTLPQIEKKSLWYLIN